MASDDIDFEASVGQIDGIDLNEMEMDIVLADDELNEVQFDDESDFQIQLGEGNILRPWLGHRGGSLDITGEVLLIFFLVFSYIALTTLLGLKLSFNWLGGLCALCVLIVPGKWIFLFYVMNHERDAYFYLVIRIYVLGILLGGLIEAIMFVIFEVVIVAGEQFFDLFYVVPILRCGSRATLELLLGFGFLYSFKDSNSVINKYSGLVYGMALGNGIGATEATVSIVRKYLETFSNFSGIPYFLWILRDLYSLSILMMCIVHIGVGLCENKFISPKDQHRPKSLGVLLLVAWLVRIVFISSVMTIEEIVQEFVNHRTLYSALNYASLSLWLYVVADCFGLLFAFSGVVYLFKTRSRLTEELNQYLPAPSLGFEFA